MQYDSDCLTLISNIVTMAKRSPNSRSSLNPNIDQINPNLKLTKLIAQTDWVKT